MATYKISGLTSATAVSATDRFETSKVSASGFGSRQATASQVRTYILDSISGYTLAKTSLANVSATTTLDLANSNFFSAQVSGSVSWVFANPPTSTVAAGFILELTNGGGYTNTWPTAVKWPNGTVPTITTSGTDVFTFITDDGGAIWRGVQSMQDSK
jgi:hypothetical protein